MEEYIPKRKISKLNEFNRNFKSPGFPKGLSYSKAQKISPRIAIKLPLGFTTFNHNNYKKRRIIRRK